MILTLEANLEENKRLYKERTHYSLQLKENLDLIRKEAALQVTKTKNFSECQMLKYVEYIKQLEQKLVEHRAITCLEFQKRDQVSIVVLNRYGTNSIYYAISIKKKLIFNYVTTFETFEIILNIFFLNTSHKITKIVKTTICYDLEY